MKLKCLRDFSTKVGKRHYVVHKGYIIEVDEEEAKLFLERNLAVVVEEPKPIELVIPFKIKAKVSGKKTEVKVEEPKNQPEELEEETHAISNEREFSDAD